MFLKLPTVIARYGSSRVNFSNILLCPVHIQHLNLRYRPSEHKLNLKSIERTADSGAVDMRDLTQGGRDNLATCLAMITLTAIMIIARFATRISQRQRPLAADWLCFWAVIVFWVNCMLILRCMYLQPRLDQQASLVEAHLGLRRHEPLANLVGQSRYPCYVIRWLF